MKITIFDNHVEIEETVAEINRRATDRGLPSPLIVTNTDWKKH